MSETADSHDGSDGLSQTYGLTDEDWRRIEAAARYIDENPRGARDRVISTFLYGSYWGRKLSDNECRDLRQMWSIGRSIPELVDDCGEDETVVRYHIGEYCRCDHDVPGDESITVRG